LSSGQYDADKKLFGNYFTTHSDVYFSGLGKSIDEYVNKVLTLNPPVNTTNNPIPQTLTGLLPNPFGDIKTIPGLVSKYARIVPAFIAGWVVLNIMLFGTRMIMSDGKQEKINALNSQLRWGGFGLLIMLIVYALMASFESIVGWLTG